MEMVKKELMALSLIHIFKKHSYPRSVGRYDSCGHRILFMAIAPIFRHDSQV